MLTNAVFAPMLSELKQLGREARLRLRQAAEVMDADPDWAVRCGLTEELDKLRSLLPEKGKLVYGYISLRPPKGRQNRVAADGAASDTGCVRQAGGCPAAICRRITMSRRKLKRGCRAGVNGAFTSK